MANEDRRNVGIALALVGAGIAGFFVSNMLAPLPDYPGMLGLGPLSAEGFFLGVLGLFAGLLIALRYSRLDVLPIGE